MRSHRRALPPETRQWPKGREQNKEAQYKNADLEEEEESNVRRMETFKCDVAGPISLVPFAVSYMGQALCDVGND